MAWISFSSIILSPVTNYTDIVNVWWSFAYEIDHKFVLRYIMSIVFHKMGALISYWIPCLTLVTHWIFTWLFHVVSFVVAFSLLRIYECIHTVHVCLQSAWKIEFSYFVLTQTNTNCLPSIIHRSHKSYASTGCMMRSKIKLNWIPLKSSTFYCVSCYNVLCALLIANVLFIHFILFYVYLFYFIRLTYK